MTVKDFLPLKRYENLDLNLSNKYHFVISSYFVMATMALGGMVLLLYSP